MPWTMSGVSTQKKRKVWLDFDDVLGMVVEVCSFSYHLKRFLKLPFRIGSDDVFGKGLID
jgi:hypothetical protein